MCLSSLALCGMPAFFVGNAPAVGQPFIHARNAKTDVSAPGYGCYVFIVTMECIII